MHGLNCEDCTNYTNTKQNSYIAGWSNFDPHNDKRFVFINLLRCTNLITTIGLVMHELIHHSFYLHHYDIEKEEEVISWAENELYEIIDKILFYLNF
jgi:hypothetical protein